MIRAGALPPTTHAHTYRRDIAVWWCHTCQTVTDYCTQENPR